MNRIMPKTNENTKIGFIARQLPKELHGRGLEKLTQDQLEFLAWSAIPDLCSRIKHQEVESLAAAATLRANSQSQVVRMVGRLREET